jgi:hypothetical protein
MASAPSPAIPHYASVIFFGTGPEFWLNLQSLYDLRLAEEASA